MEKLQALATVGENKIFDRDVEFVMKNFDAQTAAQFNSPEGKKRIVHELVNQELFYLDAIDNAIEQEADFSVQFDKMRTDFIKQYYMNKLLGSIIVEDSEIVEFYDANRSMFVEGEGAKASHILVDDEAKALDISKQLEDGLEFEAAAKQYSKCPSKDVGGDLGYFTRGKMVPEFEEACFSMKPGEVSGPVKTQFGYHIIKLVEKKEPKIVSLEEVKENIKNHILSRKQQEVYLKKADELKNKYPVQVNI